MNQASNKNKAAWQRRATLGVALAMVLFALLLGPALANDLVNKFRQDTKDHGITALQLARKALTLAVERGEQLPLPKDVPPLLKLRGAVFVSSMGADGAPRCCMGTLEPRERTLAEEIIANAFVAGAHDKRFAPLKPADLKKIRVIVSIIGDVTPVNDPLTLDPVQVGVAARGPRETGVVLPGETDDAATMVRWARIRAGVKQNEPVEYLRVEAIRYMEPPPNGKEKP